MTRNMPIVSIIVPVYKVERYIHECLDSIKAQTFTEWECLLIDDGSPDNSGKICDEYALADNRFRVFHVKNGGVSHARNIGLDNMFGEWVLFVDSDDAIANNTLDLCLNITERHNLDILQFSFAREKGELGKHDGFQTNAMRLEDYAKARKYKVCAAGSFLRASIINGIGLRFDPIIKLAEDQLFVYQYMDNCSSLMRISNCLYWYRPNENSASRNQKTEDIVNSIEALVKLRNRREHWRPVIDKVVTLFLVDIINNHDMDTMSLVKYVKYCDISDSSLLTGTYKIFYNLNKISVRLAICFVKYRYKY